MIRPYCATCRTAVRGTMAVHLATRRHRTATHRAEHPSTARGRTAYSARRARAAHAYAMLAPAARAAEDDRECAAWIACGRPDLAAFTAAWHRWPGADPAIVAALDAGAW